MVEEERHTFLKLHLDVCMFAYLLLGFAGVALIKYVTSLQVAKLENRMYEVRNQLTQASAKLALAKKDQKRADGVQKQVKERLQAVKDTIADLEFKLTVGGGERTSQREIAPRAIKVSPIIL